VVQHTGTASWLCRAGSCLSHPFTKTHKIKNRRLNGDAKPAWTELAVGAALGLSSA